MGRRTPINGRRIAPARGYAQDRVRTDGAVRQNPGARIASRGILRGMSPRLVKTVPVPRFLYGTAWKEAETEPLVRRAVGVGFRGIDTANQRRHYFEAAVGDALRASPVPRSELFLQTKFTYPAGQDHRLPYDAAGPPEDQVRQSFASSLEHLGTTYLDSVLLHGPQLRQGLTETDYRVWRALEGIHRSGQTRLIGVSNVTAAQLTLALKAAEIPPAFVQNRCYASAGWDADVRALCAANDVVYQGFSLLTANPAALCSPAVLRASQRAGQTPAACVFRFAMQLGMLPITGTSSERHMTEALAALTFELEEGEMESILRTSG